MKLEFENAQEMARISPATFHAPDIEALTEAIKPGDLVKVCVRGTPGETFAERFWVIVQSVCDNEIVGTVDNYLVWQPLKAGDLITFKPEHVYAYLPNEQH